MMPVHHGFFWIKGKAGTGKSTIMKYVVDLAEANCSDGEHILSFFFNARGGPMETSLAGFFRSMLHQMLEKIPRLFDLLDKRRIKIARPQGWSSALLQDVLRNALTHLEGDSVTFYVDAMDECCLDDIENIIRFFDDLGDSELESKVGKTSQLYVCLSSRHYPNLTISKSVTLVLEYQQGHYGDIRKYIHRRLMIDDESLKGDLATAIEKKASGIFMWVVLVVALLNKDDRRGNAHEIHKRLDELPAELSDLFEELLGRGTCNSYLPPLLRWVAFCVRPLTRKELYSALLLEIQTEDSAYITHEAFKLVTLNTMDKFILESSKGLVEITQTSNESVQFIHESVRTYFLKEGLRYLTKDLEAAETILARGRPVIPGTDDYRLMIATCYDRIKQRCLSYLMETMWKNVELPTLLPEKYSPALRELRARVQDSFPLFAHAIHELFEYAEYAHRNGLQQREFLDSLQLIKFGTLHNFGGRRFTNYMSGEVIPTESTPWYKAKLLVIYSCPMLANVVLETVSVSHATRTRWTELLTIGLTAVDIEVLRIILKYRKDPDTAMATDGWHFLHEVLEGPHRDVAARALKRMAYYRLDNLHNAIVTGDIAAIRRHLSIDRSFAWPSLHSHHKLQPLASQISPEQSRPPYYHAM